MGKPGSGPGGSGFRPAGGAPKEVDEPGEVLVGIEAEFHAAAAVSRSAGGDGDLGSQCATQVGLHEGDVGVGLGRGATSRFGALLLDGLLGVADGQAVVDDLLRESLAGVAVFEAEQRSGVPGADSPGPNLGLRVLRQVEKAEGVEGALRILIEAACR